MNTYLKPMCVQFIKQFFLEEKHVHFGDNLVKMILGFQNNKIVNL